MNPRQLVTAIFLDAVAAADPELAVRRSLKDDPLVAGATVVIASGKAAVAMTRGFAAVTDITRGMAVTTIEEQAPVPVIMGGHPEPNPGSVAAARRALELAASAGPGVTVVYLVSGGSSALLALPARCPLVPPRVLLPAMSAPGRGDVVLVSPLAAPRPRLLAGVAYSASKAAARAYMPVLSEEVRAEGIRCITVFPGEVDTPILDNRPLPPDADARATMMMPEDIADTIVLAVSLPRRTSMTEVTLAATQPRDMRDDFRVAREKRH